MFTTSLLISYYVSLPQHSSFGIYSFEVLRPLWETSISLTRVSTLIKHHTIRNSQPGLVLFEISVFDKIGGCIFIQIQVLLAQMNILLQKKARNEYQLLLDYLSNHLKNLY